MINIVTPDKQKASALKKMAEITLQRLESTDILKYPSNALTDYYDILHKLMEALGIRDGIKFSGEGAHQELIAYTIEKYELEGQASQLLEQMRVYRNRISYEGFMINKNYIVMNKDLLKNVIARLFDKLKID